MVHSRDINQEEEEEEEGCSQPGLPSLKTSPSLFSPSLPLFSSIFYPQTDKIAHLISAPVRPHTLFSKVAGTYRSLSVSVRVLCCRRWTMKTVTATPMMSPMATTPPRIPITPPGGPCAIGFSADKRRNNSVRIGSL